METCMGLSMSGIGGTTVTLPSQLPARLLISSKEACALDWARAAVASDSSAAGIVMRRDFTVVLLFEGVLSGTSFSIVLYLTITLYTMSRAFCDGPLVIHFQ